MLAMKLLHSKWFVLTVCNVLSNYLAIDLNIEKTVDREKTKYVQVQVFISQFTAATILPMKDSCSCSHSGPTLRKGPTMLSDTSALAPRGRLCGTDIAKDLLFV